MLANGLGRLWEHLGDIGWGAVRRNGAFFQLEPGLKLIWEFRKGFSGKRGGIRKGPSGSAQSLAQPRRL